MQPLVIDFTEIDDSGLMNEGVYPAIVTDAQILPNSAKDSQNIVWHFEITEGDYSGRQMRFWTSFKQTVLWRMKAALKAAGVDMTKPIQFEIDEDNHVLSPEIVGKPVLIVIVNQPDTDKVMRSNITEIRSIDEAVPARAGGDPLADQLKGARKSGKTEGGLKLK